VQYGFSKLMQRIFNYGDIQNISLTADKELNIFRYGTPSPFVIHRSYTVLKMLHFWPTLYESNVCKDTRTKQKWARRHNCTVTEHCHNITNKILQHELSHCTTCTTDSYVIS